jgi:hypothetical protein
MNNLEIKVTSFRLVRIFLSVLLIIDAVIWFIVHLDSLSVFHIAYSVCFILVGIFYMSNGLGLEKIKVVVCDGSVRVGWFNKIRVREVFFNEIEGIYLKKYEIIIGRLGKKAIKFRMDFLEVKQRREVYDFFISLSKEKGLNLVRQFDSQV